jgi:hypothetical protein
MTQITIPIRYLPQNLSRKDKSRQLNMLVKSRTLYKKGKYYERNKVKTYKSKLSRHIRNARKIYNVDNIKPSRALSAATGCSISAMRQIVRKGEGAYFSSGSRPNQTAQSWGLARLASSLTGGKSAAVDYKILESGCAHDKKAFVLARRSVKKYKHGQSKTRKTRASIA